MNMLSGKHCFTGKAVCFRVSHRDLCFPQSPDFGPSPWGTFTFSIFLKNFIGVQLLYNVVLVSAVQQINQLYIHMQTLFLDFFPIWGVWLPELYSRFSLVICFTYSRVQMSIPVSQFIPPLLSQGEPLDLLSMTLRTSLSTESSRAWARTGVSLKTRMKAGRG